MTDERNNRVLIIDDAEDIHQVFRRLLGAKRRAPDLGALESTLFGNAALEVEDASFELGSALQGREGVELARAALADGRPYAMAFVDMRMPPGWDGLETIQHLWVEDPDLEIVICTAFSDYTDREIVQRLGRSDQVLFLRKPFESIEARQLARALTEKWSLRQQSRLRMAALERAVATRTRELSEVNLRLVDPRGASTEPARTTPEVRLGRLAAGLANELDTALHRLDATLAGAGAETLKAAQHLRALVRGMVRLAGEASIPQTAIDLNQTVATVLDVMREGIESCARLETSFGEVPPLSCAPGEINLLVLGLVDGAVQAMAANQGMGTLSIATRVDDGHVMLTISDSGAPVPIADRQRIFEPFYASSSGLRTGLHLAWRIVVEQHGGSISLETSQEGQQMVVLRLPLHESRIARAG